MASSRRSIVRLVSPATLLLLLVGVVAPACYKPNILDGMDGGLRCNLEGGAKACPDGFLCDTAGGRCVRQLPDGGGSDKGDGMMPDADGGDMCPEPIPGCTPGDAGICDPVCQSGCGCGEKCSVNTAGALTCKQAAAGQPRTLMQPCQIQAIGTANQVDPCVRGLVCLEDSCSGAGAGRCYQFCRSNTDCTNAPCSRDIDGGFKVCDVPYDECVPLSSSDNTGCPGAAIGCYLSTSDPRKTICDCEFPPGLGETDICTRSRECHIGLVCVDPNGQGFRQCTRVCRLTAVPSDCQIGTCRMYSEGGVANATYGFCR